MYSETYTVAQHDNPTVFEVDTKDQQDNLLATIQEMDPEGFSEGNYTVADEVENMLATRYHQV
jgi:hypothetical protein